MAKIPESYKEQVKKIYGESEIAFTEKELESIDYADFGLENLDEEGLNLILYVNNERYCAKEMVLLPDQACPEHQHPDIDGKLGKQETFRCRWGKVYLYVDDGTPLNPDEISVSVPEKNKKFYTASKEYILLPGEQFTIPPRTWHWFKAGEEGAVVSEFSSPSFDEYDVFTNPNVKREIRDR